MITSNGCYGASPAALAASQLAATRGAWRKVKTAVTTVSWYGAVILAPVTLSYGLYGNAKGYG